MVLNKLLKGLLATSIAGIAAIAPARPSGATISSFGHKNSEVLLTSDPDEWVVGGQTRRYTPANAQLDASVDQGVHGVGVSGDTWWVVHFAAPPGQRLERGLYTNTRGRDAGEAPFLNFSGDHRACADSTGWFEIHDLDVSPDGYVQRIDMDFEHRCTDSAAVAHGKIHFVAPKPPPHLTIEAEFKRISYSPETGETMATLEVRCNVEVWVGFDTYMRQRLNTTELAEADGAGEGPCGRKKGEIVIPLRVPLLQFQAGHVEAFGSISAYDPFYGDVVVAEINSKPKARVS